MQLRLIMLLLLTLLPLINAVADEGSVEGDDSDSKSTLKYLPGEEVKTQSGKKVRVWSTEGPVPVNIAPPAAPQLGNGAGSPGIGGIGVAIDGRELIPQREIPRNRGADLPREPR